MSAHVAVKGQLGGVASLFLETELGLSDLVVSVFTCRVILLSGLIALRDNP